jgi:hypothetical protein
VTEKIRESNKRSRLKRQSLVYDYKTPCVKCGESRKYVIDWHHLDPSTKKFTLCGGAKERGKTMILDELKKCVCLCRNCHAEFHYLYGHKATENDFNEYIK